jgi:hypothetical protein
MTKYNTLLNEMQPRLKPLSDHELSNICARLGDQREAARWAEAAQRVVCAWCQVVLQEGEPGSTVSHGICPSCLAKEEAA